MPRTPLPLLVVLAACAGPGGERTPVSLVGWQEEAIVLPADFAPGMPAGEELLLFAPGMFDARAPDFWSYVFVMRVEVEDLDAAELDALLEEYYDGLVRAVAASKDVALPADPATVRLIEEGRDHFRAEVHLLEPFTTLAPLDLRMRLHVTPERDGTTLLRAQVSPRPDDDPIWRALEYAVWTLDQDEAEEGGER